MQINVKGSPSFSYINVDLNPGESVVAESDAMTSMDATVEMTTQLNGGFFSALARKFLGKESMFVNRFSNLDNQPLRITLTQSLPGDIGKAVLNNETLYLQPGAFIACTPNVRLGLLWAGFVSWIAGEGLFKLSVSGTGTVLYGAFGGLAEKQVEGEYIVDTGHLVAYGPGIRLRLQLAGGLFSSFFGGEGLVTRLEGRGKVILQSRSIDGLVGWLNPRLSS